MNDLLSGLSLFAVALAVMMSAMIRLIQSGQLRQRVAAGMTGVRELAELSGITDPRDLQDIFGPPGMQRVWSNVTLAQIEDKKRLAGFLMSDRRLHWAAMAIGVAAFILPHWSVQVVLILAALMQVGGRISAMQLPK